MPGLTLQDLAPGPPLEWDANQAAGSTAVSGARVNPGLVMKVISVAFDDSYPSGGEDLTASMVGLTAITKVIANSVSGYLIRYNYSTAKLMIFYSDSNNASDAVLTELPDATNASLLIPRVLIFGY